MKIVMDFRKFDGVVGGVEQTVIQITKHLVQKGHRVIMLPKESRLNEVKDLFEKDENLQFISLQVPNHIMSFKNVYLDNITIQKIAKKEGADVIHFPYNWSFPFLKKVPCILTIHDVIPFTFREAQSVYFNYFKYKPGIRMACKLNDVIVTISEFSKSDISKKVGVAEEKIKVIPNGMRNAYKASEELRKELMSKFQLRDGFILNVGGIHERKNIISLIKAFSKLVGDENFQGKLLITGSVAGAPYQLKMKSLCDIALEETGIKDQIIFTGYVSDEELDTLMREAICLIYPSLYEGFGIPVLEAMQLGTPVITSSLTAMPEVVGEAAILVDPNNIESMAKAMSNLINNNALRKELTQKGFERIKLYSWEKTAQQYIELYQDLSSN